MRVLGPLAALVSVLVIPSIAQAQGFQHRWGGLVFDAFLSADGTRLWTVEDGGRIRHRDPLGNWPYQPVPDVVKDTLHRVHFLPDSMTGWAVGQNGWFLKTTNGGATWNALYQMPSYTFPGTLEELYDVHFLDASRGWLVGKHGLWFTTNGGAQPSDWTPVGWANHVNPAAMEIYAIDVVERAGSAVLALVSADPGYILISADPEAVTFGRIWTIGEACNAGVLSGCELNACNGANAKYGGFRKLCG
jgi:photosystem II stability/assembly factor-like uncharacterized protein